MRGGGASTFLAGHHLLPCSNELLAAQAALLSLQFPDVLCQSRQLLRHRAACQMQRWVVGAGTPSEMAGSECIALHFFRCPGWTGASLQTISLW